MTKRAAAAAETPPIVTIPGAGFALLACTACSWNTLAHDDGERLAELHWQYEHALPVDDSAVYEALAGDDRLPPPPDETPEPQPTHDDAPQRGGRWANPPQEPPAGVEEQ